MVAALIVCGGVVVFPLSAAATRCDDDSDCAKDELCLSGLCRAMGEGEGEAEESNLAIDGVGFILSHGEDCDGGDPARWIGVTGLVEADSDGFGGATAAEIFHSPASYAALSFVSGDCDDSDARARPGAGATARSRGSFNWGCGGTETTTLGPQSNHTSCTVVPPCSPATQGTVILPCGNGATVGRCAVDDAGLGGTSSPATVGPQICR
ncbi:MAG: hypothetical protein FJ137_02180 [Deltaproteobacteria bacterium]|nr:hypothetical protein [Deltaproteobacteria bacterium]